MTDLLNSEKAASKARDLLASRVTVIEKLADAAQANVHSDRLLRMSIDAMHCTRVRW